MISLKAPPAAPAVATEPWEPQLWALVVNTAAVLGLVIGIFGSLFVARGPFAGQEYHLWRWQADNFSSSLFSLIGIRGAPAATAGTEALQRYFALTSRIRAAEDADDVDLQLVQTLLNERATYENDVERLLERYIDEAVSGVGLQERVPLFEGISVTWPPVDLELTSPPRLLIRSPRGEIKRSGDTLLKNDLALADIERIEAKSTDEDEVSLVVSVGGIAAYPAIVRDDRTYGSLVETSAHEWVHHYLAFYPLGRQWGNGGDAEILNETTADLAGREIANLIRARHPIEFPEGMDGRPPPGEPPTIDYNTEMRKLRLEVDDLLAAGKIEDAERTMDERRVFFEENGYFIRKINQAFFAFYGTYAAGGASSEPEIGQKIDRVWELTEDVGLFLKVMREVETAADLDVALTRLEGAR